MIMAGGLAVSKEVLENVRRTTGVYKTILT